MDSVLAMTFVLSLMHIVSVTHKVKILVQNKEMKWP